MTLKRLLLCALCGCNATTDFVGCFFYDMTLLYPLTNLVIIGGDVLVSKTLGVHSMVLWRLQFCCFRPVVNRS